MIRSIYRRGTIYLRHVGRVYVLRARFSVRVSDEPPCPASFVRDPDLRLRRYPRRDAYRRARPTTCFRLHVSLSSRPPYTSAYLQSLPSQNTALNANGISRITCDKRDFRNSITRTARHHLMGGLVNFEINVFRGKTTYFRRSLGARRVTVERAVRHVLLPAIIIRGLDMSRQLILHGNFVYKLAYTHTRARARASDVYTLLHTIVCRRFSSRSSSRSRSFFPSARAHARSRPRFELRARFFLTMSSLRSSSFPAKLYAPRGILCEAIALDIPCCRCRQPRAIVARLLLSAPRKYHAIAYIANYISIEFSRTDNFAPAALRRRAYPRRAPIQMRQAEM